MAYPSGRSIPGRNITFYMSVATGATPFSDIKGKIDKAGETGTIVFTDVQGSGKFFTGVNTPNASLANVSTKQLKGISSVSPIGSTTGSTTIPLFGQEPIAIQAGATLSEITITSYPDLSDTDELNAWTNAATTTIKSGTEVLLWVSIVEGTNAAYHAVYGTIGPINWEPAADGAATYNRTVTPSGLAFGIGA